MMPFIHKHQEYKVVFWVWSLKLRLLGLHSSTSTDLTLKDYPVSHYASRTVKRLTHVCMLTRDVCPELQRLPSSVSCMRHYWVNLCHQQWRVKLKFLKHNAEGSTDWIKRLASPIQGFTISVAKQTGLDSYHTICLRAFSSLSTNMVK